MGFEIPSTESDRSAFEASEEEKTLFREYMDHLGLTEEDLRDRSVLDVGAGSRMFAAHVLRMNMSERIYSLEPNTQVFPEEKEIYERTLPPETVEDLKARTVHATMEEMPFSDGAMDLILGHAAVPGLNDRKTVDGFDEITRVLREGGEARLYPLHKKEGLWFSWREKVDEKLDELKRSGYDIRIEEASRWVDDDGEEVIVDRVIIRKPVAPETGPAGLLTDS